MNKCFSLFCLISIITCHTLQLVAGDFYSFSIPKKDGSYLEGYYSAPSFFNAPIIVLLQDSSCTSVYARYSELHSQVEPLGYGLIAIEKEGISYNQINVETYKSSHSLENRLEDHLLLFDQIAELAPLNWQGGTVLFGESEGGTLAALVANIIPQQAILLFGVGGGLEPREEMSWPLHHLLEEQGASQEELEHYLATLHRQFDLMLAHPTSEMHFVGQTYKWWASHLSLPYFFNNILNIEAPLLIMHGSADNQIPIESSDILTHKCYEMGKENITYWRLTGLGHDLSHPFVINKALHWLQQSLAKTTDNSSFSSVKTFLTEEENGIHLPLNLKISASSQSIDSYVFHKGRVYIETSAGADSDGRSDASLSVGIQQESDSGIQSQGNLQGSIERDNKGNTKGEVRVEVSLSKEF